MVGEQIAGQALGMLMNGYNDQRQVSQQKKLTKIQEDAQKRLADYNQGLALQMWDATDLYYNQSGPIS